MLAVVAAAGIEPKCLGHGDGCLNGGQGQNRTADTVIFSHVLYQLSYLAVGGRRVLDPCGRAAVKAGARRPAFDLPEPQRLP